MPIFALSRLQRSPIRTRISHRSYLFVAERKRRHLERYYALLTTRIKQQDVDSLRHAFKRAAQKALAAYQPSWGSLWFGCFWHSTKHVLVLDFLQALNEQDTHPLELLFASRYFREEQNLSKLHVAILFYLAQSCLTPEEERRFVLLLNDLTPSPSSVIQRIAAGLEDTIRPLMLKKTLLAVLPSDTDPSPFTGLIDGYLAPQR